jgi:hypothetical protein
MTDPDAQPPREPEPARRWLGWALVALGAVGGLWLASLPLDRMLPEPPVRRALIPDPGEAGAVAPEGAPPGATPAPAEPAAPAPPSTPVPEAEAIDPPATTPSAEWVAEDPDAPLEDEPSGSDALRDRLERQLQMNDLGEIRVELVGDRVVTSGWLARPGDRQRVALLVRSLAPDLVHEDHTQDAGAR